MLLRRHELDAVRAGRIDLAFRRWDRPRLRAGTRMRTAVGLVEITGVDEVAVEAICEAEARRAGGRLARSADRPARAPQERPVFRIGLRFAGPDPRIALRERPDLSEEEHTLLVAHLDRLDRASRHGPWTRRPSPPSSARRTRATELAHELQRDTRAFKRDVRKLKELGLTESLDTGYRLSPRGLALIRWM